MLKGIKSLDDMQNIVIDNQDEEYIVGCLIQNNGQNLQIVIPS